MKPKVLTLQSINMCSAQEMLKEINHYELIHSSQYARSDDDHYANSLAILYKKSEMQLKTFYSDHRLLIARGTLEDGRSVAIVNVHMSTQHDIRVQQFNDLYEQLELLSDHLVLVAGLFNCVISASSSAGRVQNIPFSYSGEGCNWLHGWAKSLNDCNISTTIDNCRALDYVLTNSDDFYKPKVMEMPYPVYGDKYIDHHPIIIEKKIKLNPNAPIFIPKEPSTNVAL